MLACCALFALLALAAGSFLPDDAAFTRRLAAQSAGARRNAHVDLHYAPFNVAQEGRMVDHELHWIKACGDAARAGKSVKIQYAVYNLRNEEIVKAMLEAFHAGALVQILIEDAKLDNSPKYWYQVTDEMLSEGGIEVIQNVESLTAEKRASGSFLAGVKLTGLFHSKLRIFEIDGNVEAMFTGSLNPGDNAMFNDETLMQILDSKLQSRYRAYYDHVLNGGKYTDFANEEWSEDAPVQFYYSPGLSGYDAGDRMLQWIDEEDELVILNVFSLNNFNSPEHQTDLIETVAAAVGRGALCLVVTDSKQAKWYLTGGLTSAGCLVYEATNDLTPFNAMHVKDAYLGIKKTKIITDTANWSEGALGSCRDFNRKSRKFVDGTCNKGKSIETTLFVRSWLLNDDGEMQRRALAHSMMLLTRYYKQQKTGTLSPAAVWAAIEKKAGQARLPFQRTVIYIDGAVTNIGQFVAVRGQVCESPNSCADVRIRPFSMQNADSVRHKQSFDQLTWNEDTALDWVCNSAIQDERDDQTTFDADGYGFDAALDELGMETAWRFDYFVDAPYGSWLQIKSVIVTSADGQVQWEGDVKAQADGGESIPDSKNNHAARVGYVSTIRFNQNIQRVAKLDPKELGDLTADAVGDDGAIDVARRVDGSSESTDGSNDSDSTTVVLYGALAAVGMLALCLCVALAVVTRKWRSLLKHGQNAAAFQHLQEDSRL